MKGRMKSKSAKNKQGVDKKIRQDTPLVVYMWVVGLGLFGYLIVGEMILGTHPHPWHWIAGIAFGVLGYFVGWIWYRLRGDVI